jgi:hypothetical protein
MTKPLSRTAAIREAASHITIGAHGRQYVVYMPYRFSDVDGPNTHSNPADWSRAVQTRTHARAELALLLMGVEVEGDPMAVMAEVDRVSHDGITGVEQLVAHVARRLAA